MREILFRGKSTVISEWIYKTIPQIPAVVKLEDKIVQIYGAEPSFIIRPETLEQYVGLTDIKGVKIFEGDYLGEWGVTDDEEDGFIVYGIVTYSEQDARYMLLDKDGHLTDWTLEDEAQPDNWGNLEIAGNIFDNLHESWIEI